MSATDTSADEASSTGTDAEDAGAPGAALWSGNFRLYFGARTGSLLGDAMLPVALSVGVLDSGYGTAGVGYALGAWMAALAMGVLFGGVLADRFTPRRMMVLADLVRLGIQGALAVAFALGTPSLAAVVALQFASGLATALFQPGVAGLVPRVAQDVQRANGALRIAESLAGVAGPALAGVLVGFSGPAVVFAIYATTYGISAACLFALRLPPRAGEPAGESFLRQLVEGWQEFRARSWLWGVISVFLLYGCFVAGLSLPVGTDLVVSAHGSTALGTGLAAMGVGGLVGGAVAMRLRPARPLACGTTGWVLFALYPLTAAVRPGVVVLCVGWGLAGAGLALWSVLWATTVQTQIPGDLLNRVYAYDVAGSLLSMALGRALAGPIARLTGERALMFASFGVGLACSAVLLAAPAIRRLRAADPGGGRPDED
ncbi:MFS transporter [Streptomyces sp. SP17BM10]|uniref:MFS transporter n=1 Tax=Streptomyces sp. SP17BM10 TaxID=3002530 RepID=UPI002E76A6CF|nr:MFS transporter [Streptomyces sp. SP17BM10]MEE1781591.1 MFS transporter [Streptomyces sp. SP17BM10]